MPVLRRSSTRRAKTTARRDPRAERHGFLVRGMHEAFGMDKADSVAIADLVLAKFGTGDEVNDDTLTTGERSIFYTLESKRLLTFRRIEYADENGRTLRGFLWRLNPKFKVDAPSQDEPASDSVYESLPAQVWRRQAA